MAEPVPAAADITPEWVTGLLRERGYDVSVSAVSATAIGTGQVGATYRFALDYAGPRGDAPETLVGKFPSNDPLSRETGKTTLTYLREAGFYRDFAARARLPVPETLLLAFDPESHDFAMIMGDLRQHRAGNQLAEPTMREAELAMMAAAQFHAAWWADPALDDVEWLSGSRASTPPVEIEGFYAMLWPAFRARYGDRVTPDMRRVGEAYLGGVKDWSSSLPGARCLTHNDYRPDNMLFAADDPARPVVVVDWQTVGVGCGAWDIAYYMGTALSPAMRRAEERRLFGLWRDALARQGVPPADLEPLWDCYTRAGFSGFLMGVTAAMIVVQTDRGDAMFLAMCERAAAMCLDHGALN